MRYGRTRPQLVAAVKRGVKLLDKLFGSREEWLRRIRRTDFNFKNSCTCVIGFVGADAIEKGVDPVYDSLHSNPNWGTGKKVLKVEGWCDSRTGEDVMPEGSFQNADRKVVYYGFDWSCSEEIPILEALWTLAIAGKPIK